MLNIKYSTCSLIIASTLAVGVGVTAGGPASAAAPATGAPASAAPQSATVETTATSLAITTTQYDITEYSNTIAGTAEPGANVAVLIAGRGYFATAGLDGRWSVNTVWGLVQPSYDGTATTTIGGKTEEVAFTLTSTTADQAPEPPVVTTTTYSSTDGPYITISGTARPDALLYVKLGTKEYSPRADENGDWLIARVLRPATASVTGTTFQVVDGQVSAPASFTLRDTSGQVAAPATITTTTYSRADLFTTITGTGIPGALIGLTIGNKTYDATVAPDGTWSTSKVTSLVASSQVATVFQISHGASSARSTYTLHADAPVAPIAVASPANPAVGYQPNQPFTFTGKADALADTVTVRNSAGTLIATVPVDAKTGAWSWTRANMGTSTWKLTFISNEGQDDEEKTTLPDFKPAAVAPVVKPITFTNPANPAAGYVANTAFTFRGTATPGAKITLQNDKGTVIATGITAGADGTWSWTRATLGTSIWKITAIADAGTTSEQKATLGAFAPQK